jgi:hypothetical protein
MKKKDGNGFIDPATVAWDNFQKTGKVSYYLLYKKLSER